MNYFKKFPLFYLMMFVLLSAFIGVAVYDFILQNELGSVRADLKKSMRSYKNALDADPTQRAIDASQKNIDVLNQRLDALEKDLTRNSSGIFKKLNATEGYQLVEELRGVVNDWRREARQRDIALAQDMDFSLKKYVAPGAEPMPKEAIAPIWKQVCVLDYLMQKLFACKSEKSPMGIVNVQRELLPMEKVAKTSKKRKTRTNAKKAASQALKGDNFVIDDAVTARKDKSIRTIAYRFIFTGHTDVLRRFLNQLKDFDAMLVVRSIDVRPADKSSTSFEVPSFGGAPAFGGAPNFGGNTSGQFVEPTTEELNNSASAEGASGIGDMGAQVVAENRKEVVTDNISEFTVVIEYIEVIKDDIKPSKDNSNQKK